MKSIVALTLLALSTGASAGLSQSAIVGHWVPERTAKSGLGSIWDFKPDGSLTMAIGVVTNSPYRLEGDTLILPPESTRPGAKPEIITVRFEGDHLYERLDDAKQDIRFIRIKGGKPGDAAIVGVWKSDMPLPGTKWDAAFKDATYTYTRDGVLKMRSAFRTSAGRYDVTNHTYSLDSPDLAGATGPGQPTVVTGRFELRDGKLYLTEPGGRTEDPYVRDDFE
jgi:hypothetical protein